jgi:hypothetical protein
MPDDRLRELFKQAAAVQVNVPQVDIVLARGQQRRRRTRLQASTLAWAIMLAAGFGAPQVQGSLAQDTGRHARVPLSAGAPEGSYPSAHAGTPLHSPAPRRTSPAGSGRSASPVRPTTPPPVYSTNIPSAALPPPGNGSLVLGLDSAHQYVMTRIGARAAPVRVTGLRPVTGAPPVLATNPAGGWVVTLASPRAPRQIAWVRLAMVVASGHSVPFGPQFTQATVTSAAVSRDGSRVAVAVSPRSGGARIEVLALPGHALSTRSWTVPGAQAALITALSWAPDGRHLLYLANQAGEPAAANGPVILDTAARRATVVPPARMPHAMKAGVGCAPQAAVWLGGRARYAVLSACAGTGVAMLQTSDASTGAMVGKTLVVAHRIGCTAAALNANATGSVILISYCGVYLDDRGRISRQPAGLAAAALSG